jgi:hypothetical protein
MDEKGRKMMRRLMLPIVVLALMGLTTQSAVATSGAHFFSASSAVKTTDPAKGALLLSWDEAGVGQSQVNYSLAINSESAIYACFNGGGNHPQAANKVGPTGPINTSLGAFSPINGRVIVTNFQVPGTPLASSFACPPGQTRRTVQVTYSLGDLTDTTNHVSISLAPGPGCVSFDTVNFPCP